MQTLERESTHDRKRLEVEKFKQELKTQSNKVQQAAELYNKRLQDMLGVHKIKMDSSIKDTVRTIESAAEQE